MQDCRSASEVQAEINRLPESLGVRRTRVGLRTRDDLNIHVADHGSYHFTFYEPGQPLFDRMGALDNILYWYTDGVVAGQAAKFVGDRAERFRYEFQVLSRFSILWTKRRVREHAAIFRVDPISD